MVLGCGTKKDMNGSAKEFSNGKAGIEGVGHLKMRLIDYEIIDTSIADKDMAEMMIGMMSTSLESELIFNSNVSADLVKAENGAGYQRRFLYDRSNKKGFQFLEKDSISYYSEMNIAEMMADMDASPEELAELDNMFKLKKFPESDSEILGFKCDEVTMMQPDDHSKVYTVSYTTKEIPHLSEAMGIMGKFFTGAPIKTLMYVNGLKITFGATDYLKDSPMEKYLEFNPENYKKLTAEEFEEMSNY